MQLALSTAVVTLAALVSTVVAEMHTVHFENNCVASSLSQQTCTHFMLLFSCGFGAPRLVQGDNVLSKGKDFVSDGPLVSAIAYLQNDHCDFNGENCTLLETTLVNFAPGNSGSLTGISLIPPHKFSVPTGFHCVGVGADCDREDRPAASNPVSCQEEDVNLAITFCNSV
ncbi:hypothetical protein V8D89_001635 [Ganoderma adspersum]